MICQAAMLAGLAQETGSLSPTAQIPSMLNVSP